MRKTILAVTMVLAFGWAVVQGQTSTETATQLQQNTTEQVQIEEYVPKVIIEGKWGTVPGEFGFGDNPYNGPASFDLDQLDPTPKNWAT